jgi:hypothetical protein
MTKYMHAVRGILFYRLSDLASRRNLAYDHDQAEPSLVTVIRGFLYAPVLSRPDLYRVEGGTDLVVLCRNRSNRMAYGVA